MKELLIQEVPKVPRAYQQPIVDIAIETILAGENGLIIQPTSTGKSTEAAFIARDCIQIYHMKGLYLYNENEGLDQAREKFEQIFADERIIAASFFGDDKDTDPERADIVFASYQSMNNHHEKWYNYFNEDHFKFIIVNEAHHGQAITYKEVIDYFNAPKIGMTATPEREDEKDILEIFDKIIAEISFEEAMVRGWMSQVKYLVKSSNLNKKQLKQMFQDVVAEGKNISMKQINENLFIDSLDRETFDEIYSYACTNVSKQTLLYCENIIHANRVYHQLIADGKSAGVIHSKKSDGHNKSSMKKFRENKIQFLVSVNKLNEDIDVPNVQIGVFLRCTDSRRVFFQQLGRVLRLQEGKIALVLDFVANAERLVMVSSLAQSIEITRSKLNLGVLDRSILNVSGKEFDIEFSTEELKVIEIAKAIEERSGMRCFWPSEEVFKKEVLGYFIKKKLTISEYTKVKKLSFSNKWPDYSEFPRIYSKTFRELFFGNKKNNKTTYLSKEQLKKETCKYFNGKSFTQKEYDKAKKDNKFIFWARSTEFPRIYSKTFGEFFTGRKVNNFLSEKKLLKEVFKHFGKISFTIKDYDKIKRDKSLFRWPSSGFLYNVYSKNFKELFFGIKQKRQITYLSEEQLRKEIVIYFKDKKFTGLQYEKVRKENNFYSWPYEDMFSRLYSKTFSEFFFNKKKQVKIEYLSEKDLYQKVFDYFQGKNFSGTEYIKAKKDNNFIVWPHTADFQRIYSKTFNEFFGREKGKMGKRSKK